MRLENKNRKANITLEPSKTVYSTHLKVYIHIYSIYVEATVHIYLAEKKNEESKSDEMSILLLAYHMRWMFFFPVASLARYVLDVRYNVLFIYLLPYHSNADALRRCFFVFFPFNIENAHLSRPINLIFMFVFLFAFFPAQHFR